MPLIIPPGYLHAVYRFTMVNDPEEMVTTCGHQIVIEDDPTGLANALRAAWFGSLLEVQSTDVTFQGVDVYIGQDGGPPVVGTSDSAPVVGGAGAVAAPNNTALLIRKRTDLAGRRGRGRFYMPGITRPDVAGNGDIGGAYLAAAVTAADDFYAALTNEEGPGAIGLPPVVLHRSEGAGVEPPPTPVQVFTVENRAATQRRRMRP